MPFFQGIDTEKPLLQLDDFTFTGEYQDAMGTAMLFEDVTGTDGITIFSVIFSAPEHRVRSPSVWQSSSVVWHQQLPC